MSLLNKNEIKNQLGVLKGWDFKKKFIIKKINFNSYMESINFINKLAFKAEENNHHPDMFVGWCKIQVSFTSHDKGGVTTDCIRMAKFVDSLL